MREGGREGGREVGREVGREGGREGEGKGEGERGSCTGPAARCEPCHCALVQRDCSLPELCTAVGCRF